MILIISEQIEQSTGEVIAWLNYYGHKWFRVNDFNFLKNIKSELASKIKNFDFFINDVYINEICSVWYRRMPDIKTNPFIYPANDLDKDINHSANLELASTFSFFLSSLHEKKMLGNPFLSNPNKLRSLKLASELGINIPDTIITSNKKETLNFKSKHRRIIIKPLYNINTIFSNNLSYKTYTSLVSDKWIEKLPDTFFPSLFQKYIDKKYEIRTFFMNKNLYSMAIFSQSDEQTSIDFRKYNMIKPNRRVSYKLPKEFENKIRKFMKASRLNTGSLDIIYTRQNEYVFLEVNPVGQFGMVSKPCNYYLEQEIALFLKKK